MGRIWTSIGAGLLLFASFSSSTHYSLNSYSVGPAGTSDSHSTNYYTQSTGGEVSGGTAQSTHYSGRSGGVQTEQLAVPQAPTLSNGSGADYTYLQAILNNNAGSNSYPTDVTFSIGVSTTNCFTSACVQSGAVQFVQTGGTLSTTQYYQSYSSWGNGGHDLLCCSCCQGRYLHQYRIRHISNTSDSNPIYHVLSFTKYTKHDRVDAR